VYLIRVSNFDTCITYTLPIVDVLQFDTCLLDTSQIGRVSTVTGTVDTRQNARILVVMASELVDMM